jgi:hypothetical protein
MPFTLRFMPRIDSWTIRSLGNHNSKNPFRIRFNIARPVGFGAPAKAWIPDTYKHLNANCIIPDKYHVETAVGAAIEPIGFFLEHEIRPSPSFHNESRRATTETPSLSAEETLVYHPDKTTDTITWGYSVKKILLYKIFKQPSYFDNLVQLGNC